jgi:thiosulfate/3-mercaptopyruvate sulfurtransferase
MGVGFTLISPEDLRQQFRLGHDPVVIDARPAPDYDRDHIAGAISLDWTAWCDPPPANARGTLHRPGYWGILSERSTQRYSKKLSALGISNDRPIVVYADGAHSKGRDGRIAWMLLYLGARAVSLLDGGWQGWRYADGATERSVAKLDPGQFVVDPQRSRRRTLSDLITEDDASARLVLVDTRTPAEFEGRRHRYQPRMGHLPAAVLIPFTDLFQPSGMYIDQAMYEGRVPKEVHRATHLIAYCEVGVRACTFALLHEAYTDVVVPVYDGSIMEWSLNPDLPVRTTD